MNESEFWQLIDKVNMNQEADDYADTNELIGTLSKLAPAEIIEFERIFREKLLENDHFNVMLPLKIIDDYVGDDSYLYYRCWLIAHGQEVVEGVLKEPDFLADFVTEDTEPDLEDLLYVSTDAFKLSTGKDEEDDTFPRSQNFKPELNYDFCPVPTKGEEWDEDDLPTLAPKLWKMFNNDQ